MNQIRESLNRLYLEAKNLIMAKSSILLEDSQECWTKVQENWRQNLLAYAKEKYESIQAWIKGQDWAARAFELAYVCLMLALTVVLLSNYFLGQDHNFLGLTTEGVLLFYLFIVLFAGLLTLPYTKLKSIFPLLIGYLIYFPLLFLLEWSRQLNNPNFKVQDLFRIHPLTQVHFYSLSIILVVAFALKIVQREFYVFKNFEETGLYRARRSVWTMASMAPLMLTNSLFLEFVTGPVTSLATENQLGPYLSYIAGQSLLWFVIGFLLFASYYNSLREIGLHHFGRANAVFSSLVFAVLFNLLFQAGVVQVGEVVGKYIFPMATLFQVITIFAFCLMVYVLLNRYLYASLLILLIGSGVAIVNSIKNQYRQEPLLPTDFIWIWEPQLFVSFVDVALFLTVLVVIAVLFYVAWNIQTIMPSKRIFTKWEPRLALLLVFLGLVHVTSTTFQQEEKGKVPNNVPVISALHNWVDVTWQGLSINASYKSLAYVWSRQLTQVVMEAPENYSQQQVEAVIAKYRQKADALNQTRDKSLKNQTVIYVLSESFADPRRIPGNEISQNPIPNIQQIKAETTSGQMHSDGYGGGTANMEFQSLTGLPFYNYSGSTSNLYVEVVPNMAYLPSISRSFAGQDSYVIHPSGANNYNRINIYKDLGFENLYFTSDSPDTIQDKTLEGVNVSDRAVYNEVLSKIQPERNQFFSVITMQNHVPWSSGQPAELVGQNPLLNDKQNADLTSYSRLLRHTDTATKEFLEKLKTIDKEITVVFYGDHLPGFYPLSVFTEQPNLQFETDYFIWSNKNNIKAEHPMVNSSDFGAALLEQTNSKVSPYYALLDEVLKGRQLSPDGQFNRSSEAEQDLAIIQYDVTSGKGFSSKTSAFFELP